MRNLLKFSLATFLLSISTLASSQDCQCLTSEVQTNTVTPCDLVVGTIINVSSVSEFQSAISQANNNGGNVTILIEDGSYEVASTASYHILLLALW